MLSRREAEQRQHDVADVDAEAAADVAVEQAAVELTREVVADGRIAEVHAVLARVVERDRAKQQEAVMRDRCRALVAAEQPLRDRR